jgi:hypothetical protein
MPPGRDSCLQQAGKHSIDLSRIFGLDEALTELGEYLVLAENR